MKTESLSKHCKERIGFLFRDWNKHTDIMYECKDVGIQIQDKPRVFSSIRAVMEELDSSLFRRVDSHIQEAKTLGEKLDFLNTLGADIILEDYEINLLSIVKELDNKVRLFIMNNRLR